MAVIPPALPPHPLIEFFLEKFEKFEFPPAEELKIIIDNCSSLQEHSYFKDKKISQHIVTAFGGRCLSKRSILENCKTIVANCSMGYVLSDTCQNSYANELKLILIQLFESERSRL